MEKALSLGVRPEIAAIMGMFSAVMGGVIRDTLTNEIPILFRKEVYASACLVGAILYLILHYFAVDRNYNMLISMSLIISIRMIAMKYKLSLPRLVEQRSSNFYRKHSNSTFLKDYAKEYLDKLVFCLNFREI